MYLVPSLMFSILTFIQAALGELDILLNHQLHCLLNKMHTYYMELHFQIKIKFTCFKNSKIVNAEVLVLTCSVVLKQCV